MKKSFLIFGVISALFMTNAYAGLVGEVLSAGDRGYVACPPDCSFLRKADGVLSTPLTCVNHGIECAGGHSGIRFYDEYPTQYAVGEVIEAGKVEKKTVSDKAVEKSESPSVARAAKVGSKAKKTVDANTKPIKPQDMVADGGAVAINCPANCTPDCVILSNVVLCECKDSAGKTCKADVVVSDETSATVK